MIGYSKSFKIRQRQGTVVEHPLYSTLIAIIANIKLGKKTVANYENVNSLRSSGKKN
jgi:hypothetical protein